MGNKNKNKNKGKKNNANQGTSEEEMTSPVEDLGEGSSKDVFKDEGGLELQRKRKREMSDSPLNISDMSLFKRFTEVGNKFCIIMASEKEKRKISANAYGELYKIKGQFDELFSALLEENSSLKGKLSESRVRTVRVENVVRTENEVKEPSLAMEIEEVKQKETKQVKVDRIKEKELPKKVLKKIMDKEQHQEMEEKEGEEEFVIVKTRKSLRKQVAKLEKLKDKIPDKGFIIPIKEGSIKEVKQVLWNEIVKKVKVPQVNNIRILPRGDLLVKPADAKTIEALRNIEKEGLIPVKEERPLWPRIIIYDVDRDIEVKEIAGMIAEQNPNLALLREEAVKKISPIFRRGPKNEFSTWWVCEVSPDVYRKILGKKIYLGLSLCRVVDFIGVTQCYGCQGYGHIAAKCIKNKLVCAHCGKEGHKHQVCPDKDKAPKCVNCSLEKMSGHIDCAARHRLLRSLTLRTDYGAKET